ncbi:hypothetical protein KAI32_02435 [Candidatus Pacearchaeota archaeon]|nr:hypothetical protein [Candidatus Pacearchaeota archaeon]
MDVIEYQAQKPAKKEVESLKNCLVVLVTFEKNDNLKQTINLINDVEKIAKEYNTKKIMLGPFAHLSSNLLESKKSISLLSSIEKELCDKFHLLVSEFAVEKGLLLNVRPGYLNIRFRSY